MYNGYGRIAPISAELHLGLKKGYVTSNNNINNKKWYFLGQ